MKLAKLTILAATAAIAAMAFIGASSASATPPWIGDCDIPILLECPKEHLMKHPLIGFYLLLAGAGKFNAGFVNVECASGEGKTKELEAKESEQEKEFKATLESLKFSECKGCTGVEVKTPQALVVNMETETGGWRLKANEAKVKFTGCPLGASCTYKGNLNLKVEMDEVSAYADPEGAGFTLAEGSFGCAKEGKWESGRTRVDWCLDDLKISCHKNVTPSLIGPNLIIVEGREL